MKENCGIENSVTEAGNEKEIVEAVLKLSETFGFSVIPLNEKRVSRIKWKLKQTRKASADEIIRLWKRFPKANVAIITGKLSNLTSVDCDSPEAVKAVEMLIPNSIRVPQVITPRGGRHFYFRWEESLKTSVGKISHIDIRGQGGLAVCPPSKTKRGEYSWDTQNNLDSIPVLPAMPEELIIFLKNREGKGTPIHCLSENSFMEGSRDDAIFHVINNCAKSGLPINEAMIVAKTLAKNCNPPFPENEAVAKVQSAYERHPQSGKKSMYATGLKTISFGDANPRPVEWLIDGLIPFGMVTLFGGEAGYGKTGIAIEIASRLSKGETLSGERHVLASGSTLFVSTDGSLDFMLAPRAMACGADVPKLIYCPSVFTEGGGERKLNILYDLKCIEDQISQNPEIKLLVIDPIASHMGTNIDTRDQVKVREPMDLLNGFAERMEIAVIVIAHLNKSTLVQPLHRISGSMQFIAASKIAWLIIKDPKDQEGKRRILYPLKSNISEDKTMYSFQVEKTIVKNRDKSIDTILIKYEKSSPKVDYSYFAQARPSSRERSQDKAKEFLEDILKDGSVPAKMIHKLAEEAGIPRTALMIAKESLGINSKKLGIKKGWSWSINK